MVVALYGTGTISNTKYTLTNLTNSLTQTNFSLNRDHRKHKKTFSLKRNHLRDPAIEALQRQQSSPPPRYSSLSLPLTPSTLHLGDSTPQPIFEFQKILPHKLPKPCEHHQHHVMQGVMKF